LQNQLSKYGDTLPQSSSIYLNTDQPVSTKLAINLNNFKLSNNQSLNTAKTFANLKVTNSKITGTKEGLVDTTSTLYKTWFLNSSDLGTQSDFGAIDIYATIYVNPASQNARIGISSTDAPITKTNGDGYFGFANVVYRGTYSSTYLTSYVQGDLIYYKGTTGGNTYDGVYKYWPTGGSTNNKALTSTTGGYYNLVSTGCTGNTGSTTIGAVNTTNIVLGMLVTGSSSLQTGTTVVSKTSSSVTLSKPLLNNISSLALNFRAWTMYQATPAIDTGVTPNKIYLKIPLTFDTTTDLWKTYNGTYYTDLAFQNVSGVNYFHPENFRVGVYNSVGSGGLINIGRVYLDNMYYKYGNVDTSGTKVIDVNYNSTAAAIAFKNNDVNGWYGSSEVAITNLDSRKINFIANDSSSYQSTDLRNLNIRTGYVEIKLTETLARKGSPVATIV
jgi:hypothetical protein